MSRRDEDPETLIAPAHATAVLVGLVMLLVGLGIAIGIGIRGAMGC